MTNFKILKTKNYILKQFKVSEIDKKYLNWLRDKKIQSI